MKIKRTGIGQCIPSWLIGIGFSLALGTHAMAQTTSTHQATVNQALEWINAGQAGTAFQLLAPLENELAGQPEYDYLLGQSALGAGEATRAAFAFERCLSVNSLNGLCRLGMARAHMALTEVDSARLELSTIAQSAPPTEVEQVITDYLDELSGTESGHNRDTRLRAYVQLGIGYDSNINTAPSESSMAIPLFNDLVMGLSREGRSRESGFNQAAFNVRYSTPMGNGNWRFVADGNLAATGNWATHRYNTAVTDIGVGATYKAYRHQFTGKVLGQNYNLGGHNYRNMVGVLGQYAYTVSDQAEFSGFLQASQMRYPDMRLRDTYRYTGGVSWAQALAANRAVTYASVYGGWEDTIRSKAPDNYQHKFAGLRIGGMYMATPRLQLEAGVGAERRRYDGQEILFLRRRTETAYDGYLGFNYSLNRKLSVRPQYRYAKTDSSIPLNDYQRHTFMVNLRYELF
ncbi:DUF560 domain-containing protein [Alcaligenaceae bacterium]|nr:DUF560 domain-containing protein [Alcaligenaceae bacterium]